APRQSDALFQPHQSPAEREARRGVEEAAAQGHENQSPGTARVQRPLRRGERRYLARGDLSERGTGTLMVAVMSEERDKQRDIHLAREFARHRPRLLSFARRLGCRQDEVDDLVQTALAQAWKYRSCLVHPEVLPALIRHTQWSWKTHQRVRKRDRNTVPLD